MASQPFGPKYPLKRPAKSWTVINNHNGAGHV